MSKYTKMLIGIALLLIIGNIAYLGLNYRASLQATFSEEQLKNHKLMQDDADKTVSEVQAKAMEILPEGSFSKGSSDKISKDFEAFFQKVKTADLFRIKVWDKDYMVIWSNSEELIGKRFPDNHEVEEALDGEIEIEVKKGKPEHYTERAYTNYAEIYVPIKDKSGKIIGVIETYKVIENIVSQLRGEFYKAAGISGGVSLVLFVVIAVFLKRFVK